MIRTTYPEPRKGTIYVVLELFVDESSQGDGEGLYIAAGYGAEADDWALLADGWKKILGATPELPFYRTNSWKDGRWLAAHNVTLEEAEKKKTDLVDIILNTRFKFIASTTVMERDHKHEIKRYIPRPKQRRYDWLKMPYHFCLSGLVGTVVRTVHALNDVGTWDVSRIDFFIDSQDEVTANAVEFFDQWKEIAPDPYQRLMGTMKPKDDRECPAIQSGDYLADAWKQWKLSDGRKYRRLAPYGMTCLSHDWTPEKLAEYRERLKQAGFTPWLKLKP